jgi:thiocyanate desulfurase
MVRQPCLPQRKRPIDDSPNLGREINPRDAQSYFVTDGQKDIAACFDRESSRVISALKFDWRGSNSKNLRDCWTQGGKLSIYKIYPDKKTGKLRRF